MGTAQCAMTSAMLRHRFRTSGLLCITLGLRRGLRRRRRRLLFLYYVSCSEMRIGFGPFCDLAALVTWCCGPCFSSSSCAAIAYAFTFTCPHRYSLSLVDVVFVALVLVVTVRCSVAIMLSRDYGKVMATFFCTKES